MAIRIDVGDDALEVAALIAEMYAANARIEAMKASNEESRVNNWSPSFFEFHFREQADIISRIAGDIRAIKKTEEEKEK